MSSSKIIPFSLQPLLDKSTLQIARTPVMKKLKESHLPQGDVLHQIDLLYQVRKKVEKEINAIKKDFAARLQQPDFSLRNQHIDTLQMESFNAAIEAKNWFFAEHPDIQERFEAGLQERTEHYLTPEQREIE